MVGTSPKEVVGVRHGGMAQRTRGILKDVSIFLSEPRPPCTRNHNIEGHITIIHSISAVVGQVLLEHFEVWALMEALTIDVFSSQLP